MSVKIYHNPRCSKSRETLKILQEADIQPEIIEYIKTPPSASDIASLLNQMGGEPIDIMRTNEKLFKELNIRNRDLNRNELIEIMATNPILIERPIVITDKGVRLGRPPEKVLEIL